MAKKSKMPMPVAMEAYTPPPYPDNNPDGVLRQPDYSTDPAAGNYGKGKFDFVGLVGKGESVNAPDTIVETANGCQYSKGKDQGRQWNSRPGRSGEWNNNGFDGGNMTGF